MRAFSVPAVHAVSPRFRVFAYPFKSNVTGRQFWLTDEEQKAIQNPMEIPMSYIGHMNVNDTVDGGQFSILFPGMAYKEISNGAAYKKCRLAEILEVGCLIQIVEFDLEFFTGHVAQVQIGGDPNSANADLIVSGGGMEEKLREQLLFIDFTQRPSDNAQAKPAGAVSASGSEKMQAAMSTLVKSIQQMKDAHKVIKSISDALITSSDGTTQDGGLIGNGSYGGERFGTFVDNSSGLSKDTYTNGFLHILNWIGSATFGQKISYWDMMSTFSQPPLYELFMSSSYHDVYVSEEQKFKLGSRLAGLIFRKTQWEFMESPPYDDSLVFRMYPDQAIKITPSWSMADIVTGVHVTPGIMDQTTSLVVNPVTYSPSAFEQYGQRVLPIQLQGIQFPSRNEKPADDNFKKKLEQLQSKIFDVFGSGQRIVSGTIENHYASRPPKTGENGLSKGKILHMEGDIDKWPMSFRQFDRVWYITGVQTDFDLTNGKITQSMSVKWGRRSSRVKPT